MSKAAGILFRSPNGNALFLRRTATAPDCPACWDFPGGGQEDGETAEETALREAREEVGKIPGGEMSLHTRTKSYPPSQGGVGAGAPQPILPVSGGGAPEASAVDYTTFLQRVDEEFVPNLNAEHEGWAWAPIESPPQPLHPGCRVALERFAMDELGVARAIADGRLISPQRYENVWLFAIRITGTDTAFRDKVDEFVVRKPELYLNDEFLARCNGLPVIYKHPAKSLLDSEEFSSRVVGTVFLPYIAGDEVWAVAKIFVDAVARMMIDKDLSTSPGVNFEDFGVNARLRLEDGTKVLVEGKPSLLDHVAICELGVWDKGGDPAGIRSEAREDSAMSDEDKKAAEDSKKADARKDEDPKEDSAKKDAKADGAKKDAGEEDGKKDDAARKDGEREETKRDDADAGTALDKTLQHIADSLKSMHGRLDAIEETSRRDKKRGDAAEEEDKDDPKKLAADKAKKDAAKKDADEKEEEKEKAKADSASIRARIEEVAKMIPKGLAEPDYAAVADSQARADAVFADFGQKAPVPLAHETAAAYDRRCVRMLKDHSPTWKKVDVNSGAFADDMAFSVVRDQVFAEARVAALNPTNIPEGRLIMKTRRSGGHEINEFVGQPSSWMNPIAGPVRQYVTGINTPNN